MNEDEEAKKVLLGIKRYRIVEWETIARYQIVEAKNEEEALKIFDGDEFGEDERTANGLYAEALEGEDGD